MVAADKHFSDLVRGSRGVRFIRKCWPAITIAVAVTGVVAVREFRSGAPLLSKLFLIAIVAVSSFMAASFVLIFVLAGFWILQALASWIRKDPIRHTTAVLIGFAALIAWGWLASRLGFGDGPFCEPDGRGAEICYPD